MKEVDAKFLLALSSKARTRIYVTSNLDELLRRGEGVNPDFIRKQLKLHNEKAKRISDHMLDTTSKGPRAGFKEAV